MAATTGTWQTTVNDMMYSMGVTATGANPELRIGGRNTSDINKPVPIILDGVLTTTQSLVDPVVMEVTQSPPVLREPDFATYRSTSGIPVSHPIQNPRAKNVPPSIPMQKSASNEWLISGLFFGAFGAFLFSGGKAKHAAIGAAVGGAIGYAIDKR